MIVQQYIADKQVVHYIFPAQVTLLLLQPVATPLHVLFCP